MPVDDQRREVVLELYEYLECRLNFFHGWKTVGWFKFTDKDRRRLKVREAVCRECGGGKLVFYDAQNTRLRTAYFPAPGYRFHYDAEEPKYESNDYVKAILADTTVYEDRDKMHASLTKRNVRKLKRGA